MKKSWTVLKLLIGHDFVTETTNYKVQRCITHKTYIQELWFLHSAHRPILINIYMNIHEDILNGFQNTERAQFCDGQMTRAKTIRLPTLKGGDIILNI